jgi:hypothetical protein
LSDARLHDGSGNRNLRHERWLIAALLLLAVMGLGIAFTLPSSLVPDCPQPSSGVACAYGVDTHPWWRFLVGVVAVLPVVVVVGARFRGNIPAAILVAIAGMASAVGLLSINGTVPATEGDCLLYPRCYTDGHPYTDVAVAVFVITAGLVFWLWQPRLAE